MTERVEIFAPWKMFFAACLFFLCFIWKPNFHIFFCEISPSGALLGRVHYASSGQIIRRDAAVTTPFLWQGQWGVMCDRGDNNNGLYWLRTRYYHPAMASFIQQDSVLGDITDPQSLNRFAYCQADPINFYDPEGLAAWAFVCDATGAQDFQEAALWYQKSQNMDYPEDARNLALAEYYVYQTIGTIKGATLVWGFGEAAIARMSGAFTSATIKNEISTVGRVRNVAQRSFDYAVKNPRASGLNRMQLGKDAEVQASRWLRKWAERSKVTGLELQVRGAKSVPDVVFNPAQQIFDFKLTPKAVRPIQTSNFQNDFPGYSIDYIFSSGN
ncbi:MAG: RHS repeat-associated core domain-containing protein [Verrucomicrobiota bacterium]